MGGSDAQAGFYYQNIVAAGHLLDLIEIGSSIESISLENPERAKFIDDIIVDASDRKSFIQVKWSEDDATAITLHSLVTPEESSAIPLIAKLAAGFQKIRNESGTKEIVLFSTKKPGKNKQPTKGFSESLQDFLVGFHGPFIAGNTPRDIQAARGFAVYKNTLDRLKGASGLSSYEEFGEFLHVLRFRLGQADREKMETRVRAKLEALGIEHALYATLLDLVVRWSIAGTAIQASDVLRNLGLFDHFRDPLSHLFPVDAEHWVKTPGVFRALDDALRTLKSGFILLEGEPGIGKSTLLAQYKAHRRDVTFGYHCYVPDDRSLGNDRLERDAFVRSLCIGLRNAFPDLQFPQPYREYTLEALNDWLRYLSQQSRHAVFIVDGLDHVHRKQLRSLLLEPLTSVLDGMPPENVLIVLSSRYPEALPQSVQDHIRSDPRRHITVPRFRLLQIKAFLSSRGVELEPEFLDLAERVTGGVPIYLEYLAAYLSGLTEYEREQFLKDEPALRGQTIDSYHLRLWSQIQNNQETIYVLAILAVRQEFTTLEDLVELLQLLGVQATRLSVESTLRSISHVLRQTQGQAVAIKHNSFREFIQENTAALAQEIDAKLVDWYAANPTRDEAWRHRFRHLFKLGKYEELKRQCDNAWLVRSWAAYRPITEIHQNIDLAWQAAAATQDLASYVAIALLKQRVGLVELNLRAEKERIAGFLLDLGLPAEALRTLWDGEKSQCAPVPFANFCLQHRERLGRVPPKAVMQVALADSPLTGSSADLATYYRACTYVRPSFDLLLEIATLSWRVRSEDKHRIHEVPDSARNATNLSLQFEVIRELSENNSLMDLNLIQQASKKFPTELCEFAGAASALVLARAGETEEARKTAAGVTFERIPDPDRRSILLDLAEYGVSDPAWFTGIAPPLLPKEFLESNYQHLEPELFTLYDRLRVHFLSNPQGKAWLDSVVTGIPEPNRTVVRAIGRLALLWSQWVSHRNQSTSQLDAFEEILELLDISPRTFQSPQPGSRLAPTLYQQESPQLFEQVWAAATRLLPESDLLALAQWWADSGNGNRAKQYAAATRDLATHLSDYLKVRAETIARQLLTLAEQSAREDEETSVLVYQIFASASAWGRSGFSAEGHRLWTEVLDLGCGIGWRKDYQFNEVLLPLALAHEQNPGATRQRIADQLTLAHILEGAARSKTTAIAIEDLIAFASRISAGLALKMLAREENSIDRERAILSLVREWIKNQDTNLRWLWALVTTMARWDSSEYDEYAKPAREAVYTAAISSGDFPLASLIYNDARQVFLVEKQSPLELAKWAKKWMDAGDAPPEVAADFQSFGDEKSIDDTPDGRRERPFVPDPKIIDDAVQQGLPALDEKLDQLARQDVLEVRRRAFSEVFPVWLEIFSKAIAREFTDEERHAVDKILQELLQQIETDTVSSGTATKEKLRALANQSIRAIGRRIGQRSLVETLGRSFDLTTWLDRLPLSVGPKFFLEDALEKRLPIWIQSVPLTGLDEWADFCRRRCSGACRSTGLLSIAKRIGRLNSERAKDFLLEAWQCHSALFMEYDELSDAIFSELVSLDEAAGRELLLRAFMVQYRRFPGMIVHRLDRVLKFARIFPGLDLDHIYHLWDDYNRHLTAGLTLKPVDLAWITGETEGSFTDELLRHLLWLLKYPVLDVRLLACRELYQLISRGSTDVDPLLRQWGTLDSAQKEQLVSLLFSIGLSSPAKTSTWAGPLLELVAQETHFNLRRTTAEAVLAAKNFGASINDELVVEAQQLIAYPKLVKPLPPSVLSQATNQYVPALQYPGWMIERLATHIPAERLLPRIHSLMTARIPSLAQGWRAEMQTHQNYNINDNFDALEISGAYDSAVRETVNTAVHEFAEAHILNEADLDEIAGMVRVCDPNDLLTKPEGRPTRVQWIDASLGDSEFLSFQDWQRLKDALLYRDGAWTTVFEHAEQRQGDATGSPQARATRVHVALFATADHEIVPTAEDVDEATLEFHNLYRFELRRINDADAHVHPPIIPIVQISTRTFRGRHTVNMASLRPDFARELGLAIQNGDWLGYTSAGLTAVRSTTWQEAFHQGRRRHEPRSSGFLLEIAPEILAKLAKNHSLTYWIKLDVERSTDKYEPESRITWSRRSEVFLLHAVPAVL